MLDKLYKSEVNSVLFELILSLRVGVVVVEYSQYYYGEKNQARDIPQDKYVTNFTGPVTLHLQEMKRRQREINKGMVQFKNKCQRDTIRNKRCLQETC